METNKKVNTPEQEVIINQEKNTVKAFKEKEEALFTKNFADNYIGVANDGIKGANEEVAGMLRLDLDDISVADENVTFPAKDMAIMTYKMIVKGKLKEQDISGIIYTSTVFAKRENKWLAVLHTESMSPQKSN